MTTMIGKPVALIQVPNQRLFSPAAAKYLGTCTDTLYKITDLGQIQAYDFNRTEGPSAGKSRCLIESVREWHDATGEKPASATSQGNLHANSMRTLGFEHAARSIIEAQRIEAGRWSQAQQETFRGLRS